MKRFKSLLVVGALAATTASVAFAGDAPPQKADHVAPALLKKLNTSRAPSIQTLSPEMARKMLAKAEKSVNLAATPAAVASVGDASRLVGPSPVACALLRGLDSGPAPAIQTLPPKTAQQMPIHTKNNVTVDLSKVAIFQLNHQGRR